MTPAAPAAAASRAPPGRPTHRRRRWLRADAADPPVRGDAAPSSTAPTRIRGFLHLYIGEEAVAVGVMAALDADDAVVSTYREHGHALARGVPMDAVMAEMFGRVDRLQRRPRRLDAPVRRGAGGSTAATPSSAAGCRWPSGWPSPTGCSAATAVTACFFGDGAVAEGEFHECAQPGRAVAAAGAVLLREQPLRDGHRARPGARPDRPGAAGGVATAWPPGRSTAWTSTPSRRPPRRAVEAIRGGGGPRFLELRTYRFRAHSMYDPDRYRDKAEIERWKERDPIDAARGPAAGRRPARRRRRSSRDARTRSPPRSPPPSPPPRPAPLEPVEDLTRFVTCRRHRERGTRDDHRAGATTTYREAMRAAHPRGAAPRRAGVPHGRGRRPRTAAASRSAWACSRSSARSGSATRRCRSRRSSAPGIGAALGGMRPIVEIMTVNFSLLALDQILNNAATLLHMSGGQFNVPLVIRMTTGAGRQLAAQHSHSLEGWYAHIPGLRVARAGDAGGRPRHALARAARPGPGADLRARLALQHGRRRWPTDAGAGRHRPRRGPPRRATTSR